MTTSSAAKQATAGIPGSGRIEAVAFTLVRVDVPIRMDELMATERMFPDAGITAAMLGSGWGHRATGCCAQRAVEGF